MGDSCRAQRVLVATSDQSLRRSALFTFARLGCEVHAAESGIDCLDKLRGAFPDLLVLMPPLVWGSVADVLIVAREDSRTITVPILVLAPDVVFPRVPRLFARRAVERLSALAQLVEQVCNWARSREWSFGRNLSLADARIVICSGEA
jgi:CheY-like chemotaxis protein